MGAPGARALRGPGEGRMLLQMPIPIRPTPIRNVSRVSRFARIGTCTLASTSTLPADDTFTPDADDLEKYKGIASAAIRHRVPHAISVMAMPVLGRSLVRPSTLAKALTSRTRSAVAASAKQPAMTPQRIL